MMARRAVLWIVTAGLLAGLGRPVFGYLKTSVADSAGKLYVGTWPQDPTYYITNRATDGVSIAALEQAVEGGFTAWTSVPTTTIRATFGGLTGAEPDVVDHQNTIGFADLGNLPGFEQTLGFTDFLTVDGTPPHFAETDIVLNSAYPWATDPAGVPGRYDLQSVTTHEIGHFLGLGHSAIGLVTKKADGTLDVLGKRSVMFPIAFMPGNVSDRTLTADDIAGISDLYPSSTFRKTTGSISGRILKNQTGIFGAHVVAFNTRTGTLIGGFSLDKQGDYVIAGLPPGTYVVRVEPLDDLDVSSFFDTSVDTVDTSFRVAYYAGPVIVPAGGNTGGIDVTVVAK